MSDVKWIKLAVDLFDNRKVKRILAMPNGKETLLFWIRLLCLCGKLNQSGALMFTQETPYDAVGLSVECGLPVERVRLMLGLFCDLGMLERDGRAYRVCGWNKYQSAQGLDRVRELGRERVKRFRESKTESNVTVTLRNAPEEEEEKEQEKEFHSITHAACEGEGRKLLGGNLGRGLVMLSDTQIDDLLERLTLDEFNKYVEIVAECEATGKKYRNKTHYQAILEMAERDRRTYGDGML